MDRSQEIHRSHLFTVRMWPEALADGQIEWRGQVRHMASGETRYFREWPVLVAFVQDALPDLTDGPEESDWPPADRAGGQ